jgi:hypothetical protein
MHTTGSQSPARVIEGRSHSIASKELLLSLVAGKMFTSVERELAFGLGLMLRRKVLLELGMQMLGQLVVLTRMQCDLLHKTLCELLWRG